MNSNLDSRLTIYDEAYKKFFAKQEFNINFLANCIVLAHAHRGNVFIFGNGGSAAEAQHFAAELVGRFSIAERPPISAIALTTDSSILTAVGNDYSFEDIFARQLSAHGKPGDVAIGLTTSGKSLNVLSGLTRACTLCMQVFALTGKDGLVYKMAITEMPVDAIPPPLVQELHLAILHVIVHEVELRLVKQRRENSDLERVAEKS